MNACMYSFIINRIFIKGKYWYDFYEWIILFKENYVRVNRKPIFQNNMLHTKRLLSGERNTNALLCLHFTILSVNSDL